MTTESKKVKNTLPGLICNTGIYLIVLLFSALIVSCQSDKKLQTGNSSISWKATDEGWKIADVSVRKQDGNKVTAGTPSGLYTFLFSTEKPSEHSDTIIYNNKGVKFPEEEFIYLQSTWKQAMGPVRMNTAGKAYTFFPENMYMDGESAVFTHSTDVADMEAVWQVDESSEGAFDLTIKLTAKQAGYFSLSSPDLVYTAQDELEWAIVPGYYHGRQVHDDLVRSLAYGQGLPSIPYVCREHTVSTLTSIISHTSGISHAVVARPGYGRDPWKINKPTHLEAQLGFSHMNRSGQLSPTLYYPLLNHDLAQLKAGDTLVFEFRYYIADKSWYDLLRQAAMQDYKIEDFLSLKETDLSISQRILDLLDYSLDDETSLWNEMRSQGKNIGAQSYLGGVVGSDKDATKNSDIGAMWMLANFTGNTDLKNRRLPLIRNFKLLQIEDASSSISGAIKGQYYLRKTDRWVEEWGDHTEPIALTYYNMLDIGNILLFEPDDHELRSYLSLGAERLLRWQQEDGSWAMGYHKDLSGEVYEDLQDFRPTFYGLMVAYKILGEEKFLHAAIKGADWLIDQGIRNGFFTGVCGDVRFVNDFATAQIAQSMLDLWEITGDDKYKEAAIFTARIYTASVYTHPIPSRKMKLVNDKEVPDWAIAQAGLGFEHGGNIGSAVNNGPILLASHAGMFMRMAALTGDDYFAILARSAIWGRDAFLHPENKVASYYWRRMNAGAGPFPHHAWWQIGLLTDYLISEISYRSKGAIDFPAGFYTPKVGPHKTYGFESGKVYEKTASLVLPENLIKGASPYLDYIAAVDPDEINMYVFLLNNSTSNRKETFSVETKSFFGDEIIEKIRILNEKGEEEALSLKDGLLTVEFPAYSLKTIEISK